MYQQVTRAKSVKHLCDALQMEYTEKFNDAPSRGEQSASARAADRMLSFIVPDGSQTSPTIRGKKQQIAQCIL